MMKKVKILYQPVLTSRKRSGVNRCNNITCIGKFFPLTILLPFVFVSSAKSADDLIVVKADEILQIEAGSNLTYGIIYIGNTPGDASLTIKGTGFPASGGVKTNYVSVGNNSSGTLTVDNGAFVSAENIFFVGLGSAGSGTGVLNVDNKASVLAKNDIYVGYGYDTGNYDSAGTGTLTVDRDASVSAGNNIFIGLGSSGTGEGIFTVNNNASLRAGNDIYVGYGDSTGNFDIAGSGRLIVDSGASVSATNNVFIGLGVVGTGAGMLTVNNKASVLGGKDIYVGSGNSTGSYDSSGSGTLTVDSGASVSAGKNIFVGLGTSTGSGPTGTGTGTGTLTVDSGASVSAENYIFVGLGTSTGSTGEGNGTGVLTVNNGASVTATNNIYVGYSVFFNGSTNATAYGTLMASNGSLIKSPNISINNGALNIGAARNQDAIGAGHVEAGVVTLNSNLNTSIAEINFNHTDSEYVFSSTVEGTGNINIWQGHTTLTGNNTYYGRTSVYGGTLTAGTEGAFSGSSGYNVRRGGVLDLNGHDQTLYSLVNSGTVYLNQSESSAGTILTATDYIGNGGTLVFNSVLAGDNSLTDRMHITGDTSGSSYVQVINLGGQGAETLEGIELIGVDGKSNGNFVQKNRIVAGAYDYRLAKGPQNGNWYLTSTLNPLPPVEPGPLPVDPDAPEPPLPPIDPETPEPPLPPIDPEAPEPPSPPIGPGVHMVRPVAGSYITNMIAVSEMLVTRMEDRNDQRTYTDMLSGEKKTTSMWLRTEGRHLDNRSAGDQIDTDENRYVVQLGGDIARGTLTGTDSWRTGVMAGYGNSHSTSDSSLTGYGSEGNASGYSAGLYGTWFQNADQRTGAYLDSWLQYAWFSNEVREEGMSVEEYDSDGLQASLEGGYTFHLGGNEQNDFFIQPQVQVVWNGVKMDEHSEDNGTQVEGKGDNNVQSRVGLKGFMEHRPDKNSVWKPYLAANWIHNSEEAGVRMDDVTLYSAGQKNQGEVKAGVESRIIRDLSVQAGASVRFGSDDYRDVGGSIGVRYEF